MAKLPQQFETAFDTYVVTAVIGEGGAGRVFEVKDSSGKPLALKCLHPYLITTERRKRFKNEIDFNAKHDHRNLIQVLDSGLSTEGTTKTPFYVMPKFPETLRSLLSKKISPDIVLPLFSQILDGLEAAHLLGVTHRDLKPENVLYDNAGQLIVVADFGIAHFEEDIIATAVETKLGTKLANLAYSAPEQRTKGVRIDRRADIYALGLILNEMFTNSLAQGTGFMTIAAVAPPFAYLDALVDKMIQQNPDTRPASIEEIKKELIGRKNEFIALQRLDAARREIVPAAAPNQVSPVNLIGVDWYGQSLVLKLDRAPEPGWIQTFQQLSNVSYIMGTQPSSFQFQGDTARIGIEERNAQTIINQFKPWLGMATHEYQKKLNDLAEREERERRDALTQKIALAEQRERILKSLKV